MFGSKKLETPDGDNNNNNNNGPGTGARTNFQNMGTPRSKQHDQESGVHHQKATASMTSQSAIIAYDCS